MRFEAPAREGVPAATFDHPVYAGFPHADLLSGAGWPDLRGLNAALQGACHSNIGRPLRFAAQTQTLLADGLHYESRIYDTGVIATREGSWHDLFNALMWLDRLPLKCAINTAYLQDLKRPPGPQRSRRQYALTHFDEAGAIVMVSDPTLLALWDCHDWHGLLWRHRAQWAAQVRVILFGHALLEHYLVPSIFPVAKCLVVRKSNLDDPQLMQTVAVGITHNELLRDPQALRPLPLSGLAGWHHANDDEDFYRTAPCFRPLRAGRRYPEPA